jgi:hypothetical protein
VTQVSPAASDSAGGQNTLLRDVITEFGRHLDILAEQLTASMTEADRDCVSVGESFHELSAARATIQSVECPEPARRVIDDSCRRIGESLHDAVVALQYHDRLAQRLGLVRAGLVRLQTLLHESGPRSYESWLASLREVEQINRTERLRLGPVPGQDEPSASAEASHSSVELF